MHRRRYRKVGFTVSVGVMQETSARVGEPREQETCAKCAQHLAVSRGNLNAGKGNTHCYIAVQTTTVAFLSRHFHSASNGMVLLIFQISFSVWPRWFMKDVVDFLLVGRYRNLLIYRNNFSCRRQTFLVAAGVRNSSCEDNF